MNTNNTIEATNDQNQNVLSYDTLEENDRLKAEHFRVEHLSTYKHLVQL